jgi:hypothetical protein
VRRILSRRAAAPVRTPLPRRRKPLSHTARRPTIEPFSTKPPGSPKLGQPAARESTPRNPHRTLYQQYQQTRQRPNLGLDGLDGFGQLRADRSALGFGEHDMSRATRPYERAPVLSSGTVSLIER